MKKIIKIITLILLCCLILVAAFLWETNRQNELAIKVAVNFVNNALKDEAKLKEYNIPTKILNADIKLVDTNHYFNNWQFIFDVQGITTLELIVKPEKTIGIIPLFNKEKELNVVGFNCLE